MPELDAICENSTNQNIVTSSLLSTNTLLYNTMYLSIQFNPAHVFTWDYKETIVYKMLLEHEHKEQNYNGVHTYKEYGNRSNITRLP